MTTEDPQRGAALERIKQKKAFQKNLFSYLAINAFLIVIWAVSGAGFFWPVFALAGWGMGLAFHGYSAYGRKPVTEAEIQREMDRGD